MTLFLRNISLVLIGIFIGCTTLPIASHIHASGQPDAVVDYHVYDDIMPEYPNVVFYDPQYIVSDRELHCVALNIYHEARNQDIDGQRAVAFVTKNRRDHRLWSYNYCDVVYEGVKVDGKYVTNKCQFSWVCDGLSDDVHNQHAYNIALEIAEQVMTGKDTDDPTEGAVFYHATYVSPAWAHTTRKSATTLIGDHQFYRLNM